MILAIIIVLLILFFSFVYYCKGTRKSKLSKVNKMIDALDMKLMRYMYRLDKEDLSHKDREVLRDKLERGYIYRTKLYELRWQLKYNKKFKG